MPRTHSDEALEHWGRLYTANNLIARGVTFEQFMNAPATYFEALAFDRPAAFAGLDEHEPLLARQRAIAAELVARPLDDVVRCATEAAEAEVAASVPDARGRNGRLVEPLHHHAFPRRRPPYAQRGAVDIKLVIAVVIMAPFVLLGLAMWARIFEACVL